MLELGRLLLVNELGTWVRWWIHATHYKKTKNALPMGMKLLEATGAVRGPENSGKAATGRAWKEPVFLLNSGQRFTLPLE
jgi:hypothetical protein